ncbi:MAG: hypothetical protein NC418_04375, partial [Muribaculaceae bacterium]|nr:hypothetical protein [Muribaculaceae bacterium]
MNKIKISQLPAASTANFSGLFTLATDASNRSVKVPLNIIDELRRRINGITSALPGLDESVEFDELDALLAESATSLRVFYEKDLSDHEVVGGILINYATGQGDACQMLIGNVALDNDGKPCGNWTPGIVYRTLSEGEHEPTPWCLFGLNDMLTRLDSKADRSELSNVLATDPLAPWEEPELPAHRRLFVEMWCAAWGR